MHIQNLRALFSSNTVAAHKIPVAVYDRGVILERIRIESKIARISLSRGDPPLLQSYGTHSSFIEEGHQNTDNRRHDRLRENPRPTTTGAEIRMILFYLPRPETPER